MKRSKPRQSKKPDLILTSDWHLREDTPICRTDDFWEAQWRKVQFIIHKVQRPIQHRQKRCPIIHAGDLYNHWKPSPFLISETIASLRGSDFRAIYGQHDLPQHNLELAYKCGMDTLYQANRIEILKNTHFGQKPVVAWANYSHQVLVWHKLVWEKKAPHWSNDPTALEILKEYPQYDLIVTGDNHASFVVEHEGRLLVNPGSLTRQTADQANHKPRVYLWYAETNTVEPIYLPIEEGVISREHIERKQDRDKRIEAFVERLNEDWEADISFERNLDQFEKANDVRDCIMEIVRRVIE